MSNQTAQDRIRTNQKRKTVAAATAQPAAQMLREALECVKQAGFDCSGDGWGVIHMTNDDWQIVLAGSTEQEVE